MWRTPNGRGGGGVRGANDRPRVPGPLNTFHFLPQEKFADVGGWVGRPGQPAPPPLPPSPGVTEQWPVHDLIMIHDPISDRADLRPTEADLQQRWAHVGVPRRVETNSGQSTLRRPQRGSTGLQAFLSILDWACGGDSADNIIQAVDSRTPVSAVGPWSSDAARGHWVNTATVRLSKGDLRVHCTAEGRLAHMTAFFWVWAHKTSR